jgi:uncharacterized protein YuzE
MAEKIKKSIYNMEKRKTRTPYDPSWIIELVKKQHPERTDVIKALLKCTSCRWECPAYAYFNEGLPRNGGVMLYDKTKGTIIIDMTVCGKVAGIEFVNEIGGTPSDIPVDYTHFQISPADENNPAFKISYTSAGFPLWSNN